MILSDISLSILFFNSNYNIIFNVVLFLVVYSCACTRAPLSSMDFPIFSKLSQVQHQDDFHAQHRVHEAIHKAIHEATVVAVDRGVVHVQSAENHAKV